MRQDVRAGLLQHFEDFPAPGERFGYKVAFNPPAVQQRLGLDGSLVAGLRRATVLDDGAEYSLTGLAKPILEAEVVVRLGGAVSPHATPAEVAAAVDAWGPAIELVDMNRPLEQLQTILAEGVFHRAVVLGALGPPPPTAALSGIEAQVRSNGQLAFAGDAEVATGVCTEVLLHVARVLDHVGQTLAAGDHVILGSMAPPVPAEAGGRFELSLSGLGRVALGLAV